MPPLSPPPRIRLSRLRDIGWSLWDPIGLMPSGQAWDNEASQTFADEYDTYLVHAAGQLRRGASDAEIVAYLVGIETDYMALGETPGREERARAVAAAIRADDLLWVYPDS